ncbi:MAG: hypothetical protein ACC641_11525 [Acidiferrobacterales bacterium]
MTRLRLTIRTSVGLRRKGILSVKKFAKTDEEINKRFGVIFEFRTNLDSNDLLQTARVMETA